MRIRRAGRVVLAGAGIAAFALLVVLPIYWMLVTALRPDADLFSYPPKVFPGALDPGRALAAFKGTNIVTWLRNSFAVSLATTLVAGILGIPAGYAMSRFRSRAVRTAAAATVITQMMPPLLLLVPMFLVFRKLALLDNLGGLVIVDVAWVLPLTVWMMKSMFDASPPEIDEAAKVDGCGPFATLWRVVLPLALPGLAAVAMYAFIETWDEFLFARTFITSVNLWPASVGLYSFEGEYLVPEQQVMAAAILFALPSLVLFMFVRKAFIGSLSAGAVKG
ncbi:MAG TPA: carbohydrate ABC transporter permease [bacterium]|nr:carbohydrate ABC transporter permease [bacterium]